MIGKVKRWLGIEGVKLELDVPEEVPMDGPVEGKIRFFSMHAQTVQKVQVKMVEKYKRGRGKSKLIDEYQLGEITLEEEIAIPADEIVEIEFVLPFTVVKSDMETFSDRNMVFKGMATAARFLKGAKSVYRIEAEAVVRGTVLNPFATREVRIV